MHVVDIFDEVEEDLRAERLRKLLARYGGLIVALALAVVAGAAGWQGWNWYQARRENAAAGRYLAAVTAAGSTTGRPAAAASFAALAANGPAGYALLARFRAAALAAAAGKARAAEAQWNAIAADRAVAPLFRDLARLLAVSHAIDTADPARLRARLAPLALPTNPWHPLAREEQALLDLRLKDYAGARKILAALAADITAPQDVRSRAKVLLAGLPAAGLPAGGKG